jgi:hypothetical protein
MKTLFECVIFSLFMFALLSLLALEPEWNAMVIEWRGR